MGGRISRWDRNLEHPRFLLILRVVYSGTPALGLETHVFFWYVFLWMDCYISTRKLGLWYWYTCSLVMLGHVGLMLGLDWALFNLSWVVWNRWGAIFGPFSPRQKLCIFLRDALPLWYQSITIYIYTYTHIHIYTYIYRERGGTMSTYTTYRTTSTGGRREPWPWGGVPEPGTYISISIYIVLFKFVLIFIYPCADDKNKSMKPAIWSTFSPRHRQEWGSQRQDKISGKSCWDRQWHNKRRLTLVPPNWNQIIMNYGKWNSDHVIF